MAHSAKNKQKIREALLGKKWSEERKNTIRGRVWSKESRKKVSESCKGRIPWNKGKSGYKQPHKGVPRSPEAKRKQAETMRGRKQTTSHREKVRQAKYAYYATKIPDYVPGEKGNRRKFRMAKNGGHHTYGEWETLKAQYNWTCLMCRKQESAVKLTRDHIIPVLRGGSNNIENIQPLCRSCNTKKGTKLST